MNYFDVTPVEDRFLAFEKKLDEFGESFSDITEFENSFISSPLYSEYMAFYTSLKPKPYNMTEKDKKTSKETFKQMISDDRDDIAKDIAKDVLDTGASHLKSRAITETRNQFIKAGIQDDIDRASTRVDIAKRTGRLLSKLFKK